MLQCMVVVHSGSYTSLFCILIRSHSLPSHHSFKVQGQESSSLSSSLLDQPIVSGNRRVGFVRWACFNIIAWNWALLICNRAASLVGVRASGDRHLENDVVCASLQLSASATLYTLQMNFSADFIVKSSRSPFPRFLSSMWCSVNVFHAVFLLWPAN